MGSDAGARTSPNLRSLRRIIGDNTNNPALLVGQLQGWLVGQYANGYATGNLFRDRFLVPLMLSELRNLLSKFARGTTTHAAILQIMEALPPENRSPASGNNTMAQREYMRQIYLDIQREYAVWNADAVREQEEENRRFRDQMHHRFWDPKTGQQRSRITDGGGGSGSNAPLPAPAPAPAPYPFPNGGRPASMPSSDTEDEDDAMPQAPLPPVAPAPAPSPAPEQPPAQPLPPSQRPQLAPTMRPPKGGASLLRPSTPPVPVPEPPPGGPSLLRNPDPPPPVVEPPFRASQPLFQRKRPADSMLTEEQWYRSERNRLNAQVRRRDGRPPTPLSPADGRRSPRALWEPTPNPSQAPSTTVETPSEGDSGRDSPSQPSPVYDMSPLDYEEYEEGGQAQPHNQSPNYSDLDYDDNPNNYDSQGFLLPGGTEPDSPLSSVPEERGGASRLDDLADLPEEDGY